MASRASGEYSGLCGGGSSSRFKRWQLAGFGGGEQRHLALLFHPLALARPAVAPRCAWVLRAAASLLGLHVDLAGLAALAALGGSRRAAGRSRTRATRQVQAPRWSMTVSRRDLERQRGAGHPGRQHQQGGAEEVQARLQAAADGIAGWPAGLVLGCPGIRPMQRRRSPQTGHQQQHESRDAQLGPGTVRAGLLEVGGRCGTGSRR